MLLGAEVKSGTRQAIVAGTACVVAAYLYWGLLRLARGFPRLLAAVPVLIIYAILPVIFVGSREESRSVTGIGLCFWFFTWLGSFKLILLCWDAGPASQPWVLASYFRFTVVMHMPMHISRRARGSKDKLKLASVSWWENLSESGTWFFLASRSLLKVLILAVVLQIYTFRSSLPLAVIAFAYSVTVYIFSSLVLEAQAAIWVALFGVELEPHFDKPFAATSLEDFWARRWNVVVSAMLREVVYDPTLFLLTHRLGWVETPRDRGVKSGTVRQSKDKGNDVAGVEVKVANREVPSKAARFSAMLLTFVTSGIMHELVVFYMASSWTWTGEMLTFFTLHGVATGLQVACKPYVSKAVRIPTWLSVLLTLGFTFTTAVWLFFPPFISTGIDLVGISELNSMLGLG